MDLSRLDELKKLLCSATTLQKPFEFFLDHFGEDDAFMDASGRVEHELLQKTIRSIVASLGGVRATVGDFLLLSVPGTKFIHGGCVIGNRLASVLYFDDVQTGILRIEPFPPGGNAQYSRFRLQKLPPAAVGSEN